MKTLALISLLAAPFTLAQSAADITGKWTGTLEAQGARIRVVVHIERDGDGHRATLDSPDQGATGIPISSVTFVNPELRLELANLGAGYEAKLDGDTLTGTWRQGGVELPLTLTRAGDLMGS